LAVSAVFVVLSLPFRVRLRVLVLTAVTVSSVAPFMLLPDVSDVVSARLATLTEPDTDDSALSRLEGHTRAMDFVGARPFGGGIGFSDARTEEVIGMRDSVFVAALVQFGLFGAALCVAALCVLARCLWDYYRHAPSPEALGLACAGIGLLSTVAFGTVNAGPSGILLWLIGGLAAASKARRGEVPAAVAALRWTPDVPVGGGE
jgi:hypothetical protein